MWRDKFIAILGIGTQKKLENREVPKGPPLILPGISDVKGPP